MNIALPRIIQGGMGAGVSHWPLAQVVSRLGQLGVVSGTALEHMMIRRLQDGDHGGHMRRGLEHLPFKRLANRILEEFFKADGRKPGERYRTIAMHTIDDKRWLQELSLAGNFVEVFLAREGHNNPVGINYLEKIQLPHLPSLYGAMLAGVAVVIVGAGIPLAFPPAIEALAMHQPASYPLGVTGALPGEDYRVIFDPAALWEGQEQPLAILKPDFLPIVSSDALAGILCKRAPGGIAGFVVEGNIAGGHNAPPRGVMKLTDDGQPIYGARDGVNMEALRGHGLPFWLAGGYGSPERVKEALAAGAAGVQVGTAFALCSESGLTPEFRRTLISQALAGTATCFTDPRVSPTGFPFKVAQLDGTLSDIHVYQQRKRTCDLGFLRELYRQEDGSIGYRCPAEPEASFLAKGGKREDTTGRKCLCNALTGNVGLSQRMTDGSLEGALVTVGDDIVGMGRFCSGNQPDFSAEDVIRKLLS